MKGMIFTEFLDMVEGSFGLAVKDRVIAAAGGAHDGAYTAVGNYDHREMVAMASELSAISGMSLHELFIAFGHHAFGIFVQHYGQFFEKATTAMEFLAHVESYIHVEVRKLYPDAELPSFTYPPAAAGELVMDYRSPRPMAAFAEGLVRATIKYYGTPLQLTVQDLAGGSGKAVRFTLKPE